VVSLVVLALLLGPRRELRGKASAVLLPIIPAKEIRIFQASSVIRRFLPP
jgi:hypothetical protein